MYEAFLSVEGPHSVYAQKSGHFTCLAQGEEIEGKEYQKSASLNLWILPNIQNTSKGCVTMSSIVTEAVFKKKMKRCS